MATKKKEKPKTAPSPEDSEQVELQTAFDPRPDSSKVFYEAPSGTQPPALIEKALQSGVTPEVLERLLNLQQRWEENQARKAYANAITDLRPDLPEIVKTRKVDFTTERGRTHYQYEDLPSLVEALSPPMAKHGLSFRWRTASEGPDKVTVFVIVSHRDGHSEESSLTAKHDTSGNKNHIQAIGSVVTYLQRYTLKAAVGVAASTDDDAQSAGTSGQQNNQQTTSSTASDKQQQKQTEKPTGGSDPMQYRSELKRRIFAHIENTPELARNTDHDKLALEILSEVTRFQPKDDKTKEPLVDKEGKPVYREATDWSKLTERWAQGAIGQLKKWTGEHAPKTH